MKDKNAETWFAVRVNIEHFRYHDPVFATLLRTRYPSVYRTLRELSSRKQFIKVRFAFFHLFSFPFSFTFSLPLLSHLSLSTTTSSSATSFFYSFLFTKPINRCGSAKKFRATCVTVAVMGRKGGDTARFY